MSAWGVWVLRPDGKPEVLPRGVFVSEWAAVAFAGRLRERGLIVRISSRPLFQQTNPQR